MAQPLISIVVPVYKVEKYLDRCLRSLTGQTYENLEILLVDDGSPDGSGAVCDAWAAKDSRIRVIHKENAGAGAARNTALELARGEFIGFVDSDDYISPHMYQHLMELMDDDTDITECHYLSTEQDDAGFDEEPRATARYTPQEAMLGNIRETVFTQLIWNKLYRRCTLEHVRFPVGKTIDDEYFTYQALGNARSLVRSEMCCYAYRQQSGSVMHRPYSVKRLDGIQAKRERLHYLRQQMPELQYEGELDLFMGCLITMQSCLSFLKGEEQKQGKKILYAALEEVTPLPIRKDLPLKKKALLWAAQRSFEGTARTLNFLIRIHVLT